MRCGKCVLLFLILASGFWACERPRVKVIHKAVKSPEDIVPIDSSLVKPYDYSSVVSLEGLDAQERKQKFVDLLLPAILVAKLHFSDTLEMLKRIDSRDPEGLEKEDTLFLNRLMLTYRADDEEQLIRKLHTHPNSIVLAQAALESGWGTSRFFLKANNVFGVWSFNEDEPRIEASSSRNGIEIYLKKYRYLSESIEDYFRTLARGPYRDFRIARTQTDNPYQLIPLLKNYSENDSIYAAHLRQVIRFNDLQKYDDYRIDPEYLR